jgi:hypothetical protein
MKRMKQQEREQDQRRGHRCARLTDADLAQVSGGDVYMQYPKGSNNRSEPEPGLMFENGEAS